MPFKHIYLTRHAQAGHNVAEDYSIPDAELTALGRRQSAQLHEETKDGLQKTVELIVSSPVSCADGNQVAAKAWLAMPCTSAGLATPARCGPAHGRVAL